MLHFQGILDGKMVSRLATGGAGSGQNISDYFMLRWQHQRKRFIIH